MTTFTAILIGGTGIFSAVHVCIMNTVIVVTTMPLWQMTVLSNATPQSACGLPQAVHLVP